MKHWTLLMLAMLMLCLMAVPVNAVETPFSELSSKQQLSEDILRELIAFESTADRPDEIKNALQAMADRLLEAGFDDEDVELINPGEDNFGLVVRYRGMGTQKPVLLLAHIDVVQAVAGDWTFPPYTLGSEDGYYLGRGTEDNKAGVAQIVSNLVRLKSEDWVPGRDIIGVLSGNEESSGDFAAWLARQGGYLSGAEFALNTDAGGGEYDEQGEPRAFWVQTSEKLYQTYQLTTHNKGGHSSVPRADNAIRDLALAITRLTDHQFPVILNNSTRLGFSRSAEMYPDEIANDMRALADDDDAAAGQRLSETDTYLNAMLRTTCVPTMLSGGHAENALPRSASVTVNCRILPGTRVEEIEAVITGLVGDLDIEIQTIYEGLPSDVSDMPDALSEQVESLVEEQWGEIPVIPSMSTGATDGLFFRNADIPVYGMSALFGKPGDSGAHGLNERIGIREFHDSVAFWYKLMKTVAK